MTATDVVPFFQAGGTLRPDAPCYISRAADDQLFTALRQGSYCYVLTARQRGKSSLMQRTAARLRASGIRTAIVDLCTIGTQASADQWYLGIAQQVAHEVGAATPPTPYWRAYAAVGAVQRFTDYLRDVLLTEIDAPIVIFLDEIDTTLNVPFSDDFFAAIRVLYNLRASDPAYDRLTFVLLGVATPGDLIKDASRTPFNIGQRIHLEEFQREDVGPIAAELNRRYPGQGDAALDRVFYWTGGHPYLTQRVCAELTASHVTTVTPADVDQIVGRTLLSPDARDEHNVQSIVDAIRQLPDRRAVLSLYLRVHRGETVKEDLHAPIQDRLRLLGLVRGVDGQLAVRNEVYRRVFSPAWARALLPVDHTQRVLVAAVLVIAVAVPLVLWLLNTQRQQLLTTTRQVYLSSPQDPGLRLSALNQLCTQGYAAEARDLFFAQSRADERLRLVQESGDQRGSALAAVLTCLRPGVDAPALRAERATLLTEMCAAVCRTERASDAALRAAIDPACGCQ